MSSILRECLLSKEFIESAAGAKDSELAQKHLQAHDELDEFEQKISDAERVFDELNDNGIFLWKSPDGWRAGWLKSGADGPVGPFDTHWEAIRKAVEVMNK